jgi:hypothetical protein
LPFIHQFEMELSVQVQPPEIQFQPDCMTQNVTLVNSEFVDVTYDLSTLPVDNIETPLAASQPSGKLAPASRTVISVECKPLPRSVTSCIHFMFRDLDSGRTKTILSSYHYDPGATGGGVDGGAGPASNQAAEPSNEYESDLTEGADQPPNPSNRLQLKETNDSADEDQQPPPPSTHFPSSQPAPSYSPHSNKYSSRYGGSAQPNKSRFTSNPKVNANNQSNAIKTAPDEAYPDRLDDSKTWTEESAQKIKSTGFDLSTSGRFEVKKKQSIQSHPKSSAAQKLITKPASTEMTCPHQNRSTTVNPNQSIDPGQDGGTNDASCAAKEVEGDIEDSDAPATLDMPPTPPSTPIKSEPNMRRLRLSIPSASQHSSEQSFSRPSSQPSSPPPSEPTTPEANESGECKMANCPRAKLSKSSRSSKPSKATKDGFKWMPRLRLCSFIFSWLNRIMIICVPNAPPVVKNRKQRPRVRVFWTALLVFILALCNLLLSLYFILLDPIERHWSDLLRKHHLSHLSETCGGWFGNQVRNLTCRLGQP